MPHSLPSFDYSAPAEFPSNDLLQELKTRARLRLNALHAGDGRTLRYAEFMAKRRRWALPARFDEWKLQHALNLVACEQGFRDWTLARRVLSGTAVPTGDMGGFWYAHRCELLLNDWFATHPEAKAFQRQSSERWLFPYGKQFVVGDRNYVQALLLDPELPLWAQVDRDLYACYGDERWHALCAARLNATRGLPPPIPGQF